VIPRAARASPAQPLAASRAQGAKASAGRLGGQADAESDEHKHHDPR